MAKRQTAAERQAAEAEAYDRAVFAALAWPAEPCPQPYSGDRISEMTKGKGYRESVRAWTFNAHSRSVTHGGFTSVTHFRQGDGSGTHSQTSGGPWFATEAEAYLAMRWAVCREMAETLLRVARAAPTPGVAP